MLTNLPNKASVAGDITTYLTISLFAAGFFLKIPVLVAIGTITALLACIMYGASILIETAKIVKGQK